jgi:uncharacterized LabA/DUF88 family protein
MSEADNKIALLIDGDNAQSKFIEAMLSEAGKHGKVTIRRIYGDWTDNKLTSWKPKINKYAIRPMQKFAFAKGKNSTDTAMIIDAMDILYSETVSGFCIASSDSDYTGLAQRIRENGIFVMGIGEAKKTTEAFVNACDLFVFTENLDESTGTETKNVFEKTRTSTKSEPVKNIHRPKTETPRSIPVVAPVAPEKRALPRSRVNSQPIDIRQIQTAIDMVSNENGAANLGEVGTALRKLDPGFDPRTYGFGTMSSLFKNLSEFFDLDQKDRDAIYIRIKK